MTNNEDIERKMNFIVEQQAQFAADMQRLEESQAQLAWNTQRLEESQARTDQVVADMGEAVTQAVTQVGEVVTRLANVTYAGFTDVNAKIDALAMKKTSAGLKKASSDSATLSIVIFGNEETATNL